jgi:cobalt/nickel transport protein
MSIQFTQPASFSKSVSVKTLLPKFLQSVFTHRVSQHSKRVKYKCLPLILSTVLLSSTSQAHFQELIPDRDYLNASHAQPLSFSLRFTHPMSQGPIMSVTQPKQLLVMSHAKKVDLLPSLKADDSDGKQWSFDYQVTEPGDLNFFVEPAPYWEPEEGKMIIHYTKVIVDGFGDFNGWDQLIDAPVEIEPLTRPYSIWVGNNFSAIVKQQGKPVPFAEIEIEWRNDGTVTAPTDSYITQVIKADANGTFNYVLPKAGWWGFAALIDAPYQLQSPAGKSVPVELGGLIWINAKQMQ